jgi:hypothetical protein
VICKGRVLLLERGKDVWIFNSYYYNPSQAVISESLNIFCILFQQLSKYVVAGTRPISTHSRLFMHIFGISVRLIGVLSLYSPK